MKNCKQCKKEFESKGNRAKFCSDSCKMISYRNNLKTPIVTEDSKHLAGNPDNPIVDEYKGLPITKEGQEMLKDPDKFLNYLQDNYPASTLDKLGLTIPKWKREFKTRSEAVDACKDVLEKEHGIEKIKKEVDYSTWK